MIPEKQKARQLIYSFQGCTGSYMNDLVFNIAQASAMKCCDEIIYAIRYLSKDLMDENISMVMYWVRVKEIINQTKFEYDTKS